MTEAMLALTIRGIVMVLIVAVVILQLVFGYRSYRAKSELGPENSTLHFGELSASSNSVGAFIMASAVAWAVPIIFLAPNYSRGPDGEEVAALPSTLTFQTAALVAQPSTDPKTAMGNSSQLEALFTSAAGKAQASSGLITLNGVAARLDLSSVKAVETGPHAYAIESLVSTGEQSAIVTYTADQVDGGIKFVPAKVAGTDQ